MWWGLWKRLLAETFRKLSPELFNLPACNKQDAQQTPVATLRRENGLWTRFWESKLRAAGRSAEGFRKREIRYFSTVYVIEQMFLPGTFALGGGVLAWSAPGMVLACTLASCLALFWVYAGITC